MEKFNTKYTDGLLAEQKELLGYYISSFMDNAVQLKMFLNEEIGRLKVMLEKAKTTEHIKNDEEMIKKTHQVIERLDEFSSTAVNEETLMMLMRTQALVKEIYTDGDNN